MKRNDDDVKKTATAQRKNRDLVIVASVSKNLYFILLFFCSQHFIHLFIMFGFCLGKKQQI